MLLKTPFFLFFDYYHWQGTSFTTDDFKILDERFYHFEAVLDYYAGLLHYIYEPPPGKTNNVVSEQVRQKPACTSTENS